MTYRPYPNRDRARRQVQRTRAVYRYGRVPQRYILGIDGAVSVAAIIDAFGHVRPDFSPTAASMDSLPRSSRSRPVVGPRR